MDQASTATLYQQVEMKAAAAGACFAGLAAAALAVEASGGLPQPPSRGQGLEVEQLLPWTEYQGSGMCPPSQIDHPGTLAVRGAEAEARHVADGLLQLADHAWAPRVGLLGSMQAGADLVPGVQAAFEGLPKMGDDATQVSLSRQRCAFSGASFAFLTPWAIYLGKCLS